MGMKKVNLSLIANERSRKTSFMKRKNGILKKLNELSTLCGVQACALIYSPYQSVPESWPSTNGAKEVASKFMEMPSTARAKKMMSQETYLMERITKAKEQLKNLVVENRELQVRRFMFDCLEGKMSDYRYDAKDLKDLLCYINQYLDQLNGRIEILKETGESSSVSPFPAAIGVVDIPDVASPSILVADMTPSVGADASPNINNVQYQAPYNLFDQIQQGSYNMNLNQDYSNYNLNLNLNLNSNQQQSFMNPMVEQQMGYAGGRASIPFMDGNPYNYHQLPVVDLASTSYMPSITTTTTGVYDPYINNNL
ncbi:Transcription factor MADS-box superfamily [Arabidopsis thaliana x Arabidopsis arenosa]|uniref:Transcription factor MADS-box superfamily n=1 Tax=Arabidopsis thaliana x Arabidopsis arenosa TaxID=1240361 RepID=A0A8T1YZS4_9BRAS|nr:Transcription factor MADS-box superfamily [Arabidopsis thaliana x Arabidopsis arenosa]